MFEVGGNTVRTTTCFCVASWRKMLPVLPGRLYSLTLDFFYDDVVVLVNLGKQTENGSIAAESFSTKRHLYTIGGSWRRWCRWIYRNQERISRLQFTVVNCYRRDSRGRKKVKRFNHSFKQALNYHYSPTECSLPCITLQYWRQLASVTTSMTHEGKVAGSFYVRNSTFSYSKLL